MKVIIKRTQYRDKQVTGLLTVEDSDKILFSCYTLELPDLQNQKQISCIPLGSYECRKTEGSPHIKYPHIDIINVPKRTGIKIHKGNYYSQIAGCCLVGLGFTDINADGYKDVTSSGKALEKLLEVVPDVFMLEII
ncbi:MAG: DUF5675 family protein [Bacteroidota bacterium]|jgi:hypothetical protein